MRINKFIALATNTSRRKADELIASGKVTINGTAAQAGQNVSETDRVSFNNQPLDFAALTSQPQLVIMLNKPAGYIVSRDGQGAKTIYDLLPPEYQSLQPVGRLDKNSSGLLLLTNDGQLAYDLTHPSQHKTKVYRVTLDKPLSPSDRQAIDAVGVQLEDGTSKLRIEELAGGHDLSWQIVMSEGRKRQIRRTFQFLGYKVFLLHRIKFGDYELGNLGNGQTTKC
jgi:23S rRNA pseudouridine2605 synthase